MKSTSSPLRSRSWATSKIAGCSTPVVTMWRRSVFAAIVPNGYRHQALRSISEVERAGSFAASSVPPPAASASAPMVFIHRARSRVEHYPNSSPAIEASARRFPNIEVDVAFDAHETEYALEITAVDLCQSQSDPSSDGLKTTAIDFTTVPPCFIATAAYGTPMADEIWALRRFRDRYLMTNRAGRAFVDAYYAVGPYAAGIIAEHSWLRTTTRGFLTPLVALARALTPENPAETASSTP